MTWRLGLIMLLLSLHFSAWASPSGELGTAAPARVAALAHDGSWVVLCQARHDTDHNGRLEVLDSRGGTTGDQQQTYLVLGSGPGEPIEDLLHPDDPSGRRLLILRKKHHILLQPGLGPELDLTQLGSTHDEQFDATGELLAYRSTLNKKQVIIIRKLATGQESVLDPGPGRIFSMELDPAGHWVKLLFHSQAKGAILYHVTDPRPPHRCWTGFKGDVTARGGTSPVVRLLPTAGGPVREVPDVIAVLGKQLLRRTTDGALLLDSEHGESRKLVPADCGGRVLSAKAANGSVVVQCLRQGPPFPLLEYGAEPPRPLGFLTTASDRESFQDIGRWLPSYNSSGVTITDLKTGRQLQRAHAYLLESYGDLGIFKQESSLYTQDPAGETVLGNTFGELIRTGPFLWASPLLIDLRTGKVVGTAPKGKIIVNNPPYLTAATEKEVRATVQAVSDDGCLLIGFGGFAQTILTPGPLKWASPVSITP